MRHEQPSSARHDAVSRGLMPIVRIADNPTRWTMAERMERYGCPAVAVATFAAMTLLYTLFAKFVPIISIWEMRAGSHHDEEDLIAAAERQRLGETHA